jgi:hypothetical protein
VAVKELHTASAALSHREKYEREQAADDAEMVMVVATMTAVTATTIAAIAEK